MNTLYRILEAALAVSVLAAEQPTERCSIEGRVVNSVTREPIKKAQVVLLKLDGRDVSHATASNAGGGFAFKDLEPGLYRIYANRTGFSTQMYGPASQTRSGTTLNLAVGQKITDATLQLTPQAVVAGRVLDEEGQPVANVRVQALKQTYFRGLRQLSMAAGAETNDLGEYRIFGMTPGRYYLSAMPARMPGFAAAMNRRGGPSAAAEEGYAPVYYPGTTDPGASAPVELAAGSELRGIDFQFTPIHTVRVRGRVAGETAAEFLRSGMIMLMPRGRTAALLFGQSLGRVVDERGNFEFQGVAPGPYTLFLRTVAKGQLYQAMQAVDVGAADVEGINLTLTQGGELSGRVTVDGAPATKLGSLRVSLEALGPFLPGSTGASALEDGTFTMANVASGEYRVSVLDRSGALYLKSVRFGNQDLPDGALDLSRGIPSGQLEVTLGADGGRVEGAVMGGNQKPVSSATVVLVPETRSRAKHYLFKSTSTDFEGRYTLRGVAPGEYTLLAWEEIESGAWQDPDFLKVYESKGEIVSVQPNGRHSQQLKVIASENDGAGKGN